MSAPGATRERTGDDIDPRAAAIAIRDLVKRYPQGKANAVDGVTLTVPRGEIFALLGPNGAGKSTTVGVLTTLVRPTSGTAHVAGANVVDEPIAVRDRMAVIPQHVNLDHSLTIRENLVYHAAYRGSSFRAARKRADELLERFALADRADGKPGWLSGGQAQRVIIARALMHDPTVLFCDEPSRGLDPAARVFMWEQIERIRDDGMTVLLTTHDMHEASRLADRVGIMDRGRLLAIGTPDELVRGVADAGTAVDVEIAPGGPDVGPALSALSALPGVTGVDTPDPRRRSADDPPITLRVRFADGVDDFVTPIGNALRAAGVFVRSITVATLTLEDVFLHYTGRSLR